MAIWLVTGGAGFIGSHIVERLAARGEEVRVLDLLMHGNKLPAETRRRVELIQADIRDAEAVDRAMAGCAGVYHLAACLGVEQVAADQMQAMETEAQGMHVIVDAMRRYQVRKMVYASTSAVYGKQNIDRPVSETTPAAPASGYAIAKRFNELYLDAAHMQFGLVSASLRLFNVYGPRQDSRMVIPRFFEQADQGPSITVYGDGAQTRDFTYVEEVADLHIDVMAAIDRVHIMNVARGVETRIHDVANHIQRISETEVPISYVEAPLLRNAFEVKRRWGEAARLRELVGRAPQINLADGLARFAAWRRSRPFGTLDEASTEEASS